MPASQKPDHQAAAEKIRAKLPKATRDATEVVAGGGAYSLLKHDGRTVASGNVRVTFAHDGSAGELEALSKVIAVAAKSWASANAAKDADPEGDSAG